MGKEETKTYEALLCIPDSLGEDPEYNALEKFSIPSEEIEFDFRGSRKELLWSNLYSYIERYSEEIDYIDDCEPIIMITDGHKVIDQKSYDEISAISEKTRSIYKIHHHYDIGNRSVYIESKFDPTEYAVYLQFMAEDIYDDSICISNLAIANALVSLYGCQSGRESKFAIPIDMYSDREKRCGEQTNIIKNNPSIVKSQDEIKRILDPYINDLSIN